MKSFQIAMTVCCLALMGTALAPNVQADDVDRKTTVTFSAPVEIPGVHLEGWGVLPAGTYVFKIMDSQNDRHIVQISSQDESTVYAMILAIPNYRLKPTDKTVITFHERPAGQPEALRAWFYPGQNSGEEFVYPKSKAIELAKAENAPVLFTQTDIPYEVSEPIRTVDAPVIAQLRRVPVLAVTPRGEEVQLAQVVTPPPAPTVLAQAAPAPQVVARPTLPDTASQLPLMGLFGMLALLGAFGIRRVQKRLA